MKAAKSGKATGKRSKHVSRVRSVDFSRAIQPHRYAKLRSGYKYVVFHCTGTR